MHPNYNGINVPVFSLKTATSGGIGEFTDLIPLIDWASYVGLNIIQILPINDSGFDPSPYNIQSAFALNPLLIKWPGLQGDNTPYIEYERVREAKDKAAKACHWPTDEMRAFAATYPWVEFYARHTKGDQAILEQYLAHKQMTAVKAYAKQKGIHLLGDIPILIANDSVDVKAHPELFLTHLSAGAPPDMYNKEGQNWGFPLYNWEKAAETDYQWWKERLAYASEFYDFFRLDHIVGFYRLWACQPGGKATEGHFIPQDRKVWIPQGEKILRALTASTPMQPIGEDLGTIPDEVRASLAQLQIPGTKVLRWERHWHEMNHPYIALDAYPPNSLTTVSTHDSPLLKEWWRLYPDESQAWAAFANWPWTPEIGYGQIQAILKQSHHTPSLYHINLLPEYFSAIPELAEDVRINRPGIISAKNWSWRMQPFVEDLRKNHALSSLFKLVVTPKFRF